MDWDPLAASASAPLQVHPRGRPATAFRASASANPSASNSAGNLTSRPSAPRRVSNAHRMNAANQQDPTTRGRGRGRAPYKNRTFRNSVPKPLPPEIAVESLGLVPSTPIAPISNIKPQLIPHDHHHDQPHPPTPSKSAFTLSLAAHPAERILAPTPPATTAAGAAETTRATPFTAPRKLYSQAVTGLVPQTFAAPLRKPSPRRSDSTALAALKPVRRASAPVYKPSAVMPVDYALAPEQRKEQAIAKIAQLKSLREELRQAYIKAGKIIDNTAKVNLQDAVTLVGECEDFCPEYERWERESQSGDIFRFERVPGTEITDHSRMVKRFKRSAAGDAQVLPCDVRTPGALVRSLDFLIHSVIADNGLVLPYYFCWDRTRAIRNDFTLQNYCGPEAIDCHERIARMHILFAHECQQSEMFSYKQETDEMRKTLRSLHDFYNDRNEIGIISPHEAEFRAYYILAHLYENDKTAVEHLPLSILDAPIMKLALKLQALAQRGAPGVFRKNRHYSEGSQHGFSSIFRILAEPSTPVLVAALVWQVFPEIRRNALRSLQEVWYPGEMKLSDIVGWLGYDDENDALKDLELHSIPFKDDMIMGLKAVIGFQLTLKPGTTIRSRSAGDFSEDASLPVPRPSDRIIRQKLAALDYVDVIQGLETEGHSASIVMPSKPRPSIMKNDVIASPVSPSWPSSALSPSTPNSHSVRSSDIFASMLPAADAQTHASSSIQTMPQPPLFPTPPQDSRQTVALPIISGFSFPPAAKHNPAVQVTGAPWTEFSFSSQGPPLANPKSSPFGNIKSGALSPPPPPPPTSSASAPAAAQQSSVFENLSLPAPVTSAKTRIPENLVSKVFDSILSQEIQSAAVEYVNSSRKKVRLQTPAANAIIDRLINQVIGSELSSVAHEATSVARQTQRTVEIIANRTMELAVQSTVLEQVVPIYRNLQIQKSVFTHWCTRSQKRRLHRERVAEEERQTLRQEQRRHVDFMLNAAAIVPSGIMGNGKMCHFVAGDDEAFVIQEQGLNQLAQSVLVAKAAEERARKPLALLELIYLGRRKRTAPDAYPLQENDEIMLLKLVMSHPHIDMTAQHGAWYTSTLLRYKFGNGNEVGQDVEYLLRDEAIIDDCQAIKLIVASDTNTCPSTCRLRNHETHLSGSSAAIFILSVPSIQVSSKTYWKRERLRLETFVSHLPLHCSIPMLLIQWILSDMGDEYSIEKATKRLGLEQLSEYGISQLQVISLPSPFVWKWESLKLDAIEHILEGGIKWLGEHAYVVGGVQRHVEQRIRMETNQSFENRLYTVEREFRIPVALSIKAHIQAISTLTNIHNDRILCMVGPLYDATLKALPWPAVEFSNGVDVPPLEWNSDKVLAKLDDMMKPLLIPTLFIPEEQGIDGDYQAIRGMYTALVDAFVKQLPSGSVRHAVELVRTVLTRFESDSATSHSTTFPVGAIFQDMMDVALDYLTSMLSADKTLAWTVVKFAPLATNRFETHTESLMAVWHQQISLILALSQTVNVAINGYEVGPAKVLKQSNSNVATIQAQHRAQTTPSPSALASASASRKRRIDEGSLDARSGPSKRSSQSQSSSTSGGTTEAKAELSALEEADMLLEEFKNKQRAYDARRRSEGYEGLRRTLPSLLRAPGSASSSKRAWS
ncbi:hypothetical protein SeLEV6574_g05195 [Synchytrium endobioticum]|uniref:SAC3/GANP/THP3 conserved domain-containing protein n=1 Tax=Synchytrium endobioticum TaxID=286115 RepID=A0A507CVP4_9FUNG|nr:hypothetical protein SeLEV6574_g05195 [Synchytrium endobioticum]